MTEEFLSYKQSSFNQCYKWYLCKLKQSFLEQLFDTIKENQSKTNKMTMEHTDDMEHIYTDADLESMAEEIEKEDFSNFVPISDEGDTPKTKEALNKIIECAENEDFSEFEDVSDCIYVRS